ncbi:regulator of conidiation-1 [Colletotrichum kahawae]|uniref:Regulator of conidiation-1 n=1 Tax=Colletotrichum kahawae TaxID=34407 RepID=A0AAD9Y3B6_COLKA|nr:regulator of conidiation-1 [Colletotrichum kahawae]
MQWAENLGRRANRTRGSLIISETDLEDFDVSSQDSDSNASSTSILIDVPDESRGSEIQMLVSAIKVSIDSLFRASVFIRKFKPSDRRQRATRSKAFDSRADVMYVGERYPMLRTKNESLIPKLGEANARRRQYFKYRRDHREKLASNADDDANKTFQQAELKAGQMGPITENTIKSGTTKASLFEKSEATEFLASTAEAKQKQDMLNMEDNFSAVSLANTIIESSEGELQFPPLPSEGEANESFECPYCLEIIQLKSSNKQSQWR